MKIVWLIFLFHIIACVKGISQADSSAFNQTIAELQKNNDLESYTYAFVDHYLVNPTESRLDLFDQYEKSIWRNFATNDERLAYVILLCNKGYYQAQFGQINGSASAYEKAWSIYKTNQLSDFDIIEYCLKPLGNDYSMLGDYTRAENTIKQYLFAAEQEKHNEHVFSALINLSIVHHVKGEYDQAITLLNSALDLKKISSSKKALVYSNLAKNFLALNDPEKARGFSLDAIDILANSDDRYNIVHLVNAYAMLAEGSYRNNRWSEMEAYINKGISIAERNQSLFKARELARLWNLKALACKAQTRFDQALKQYQRSLKLLLPTYTPDLPDSSMLYPENVILETLDGMADVYTETHSPHQALQCYDLSFKVEQMLRNAYHDQESKLQQQGESRARAASAIALLYQLSEAGKKSQYVAEAFHIAERTRARSLKESLGWNASRDLVKADSLLIRHSALSFQKAQVVNRLVQEQLKNDQADISEINRLIAQQDDLSLALKNAERQIYEKYPQWKPGTSIDIQKLIKNLAMKRATLVEYFAGKDDLYTFEINENSITLRRIEQASALYKKASSFIQLFENSSAINNDVDQYKRTAFELHQALHLPESEQLVIVPDGLLNFIPFEALLYENTNAIDFNSFPFLIKKTLITYQSSASMDEHRKKAAIQNVLGLFPLFKDSDRALMFSQKEGEGIRARMQGNFLYESKATKHHFLDDVNRYSVIHLSTHASAGSYPEPPSISFIDSTLYLPEIYGLHLQPELMVLSACETGVGRLVRGEGALSIARGFQYSGVRNLIFSLWKVNDHSTAELMTNFYQHYAGSGNPAAALHRAKLDYLNDGQIRNSAKSPYYWAAFVYYGDTPASQQKDYRLWWALGIFTLFAASVILLVILKRKRTKHQSSLSSNS